MQARWLLAIAFVPFLAGCFDTVIPDDATAVSNPDLPGLEMTVWLQEVGQRMQLNAVVENKGDTGYWHRLGCGEPWRVQLAGPEGDVGFREVLEESNCAAVYDVLQPGQKHDILYSWDYGDHHPEEDTSEAVPPGVYLWSIEFHVRDSDAILRIALPVNVEGDAPFSLALSPSGDGPYLVDAMVTNNGPEHPFQRGCGTEWRWTILDAEGDEISLEPHAQCDGFETTSFAAGDQYAGTFTWNGMVWDADSETTSPAPAGSYRWQITFMPTGAGPDSSGVTETAEFTV